MFSKLYYFENHAKDLVIYLNYLSRELKLEGSWFVNKNSSATSESCQEYFEQLQQQLSIKLEMFDHNDMYILENVEEIYEHLWSNISKLNM